MVHILIADYTVFFDIRQKKFYDACRITNRRNGTNF